jgi:hypothetical protein
LFLHPVNPVNPVKETTSAKVESEKGIPLEQVMPWLCLGDAGVSLLERTALGGGAVS